MYSKSARVYDAIQQKEANFTHAEQVNSLIKTHKRSDGNGLLDVACGTGTHLSFWKDAYEIEGLDLSEEMLTIASGRLPGVQFHRGDMVDFNLGKQFDAVTCLFSSIGYVRTEERLQLAIGCMARHVRPGGVLIVEPWLTPDVWRPGRITADFVDDPDLKVARMNISTLEDGLSVLNFEYLIATPEGFEHFSERNEMGLFTVQQLLDVFRATGLNVLHDPIGLRRGRGLYIGTKM